MLALRCPHARLQLRPRTVIRAKRAPGVSVQAASDTPTRPVPPTAPETPKAQQDESSSSESAPKSARKPSPLKQGGTLSGEAAFGKDASLATKSAVSGGASRMQIVDGYFKDDRWVNGTWDFQKFQNSKGETDWDVVIDAEMARRRLLEETPIPSRNDDPVNFDTSMIPWWAWVRRFHLPEAEKLNGRAAMVGYVTAGLVDLASGAGLVEQQESFFGKLLLHITVFGILLFRSSQDVAKYKNLLDEATFYDKQWNATWEGQVRPSEQEKSQ